MRTIRSTAATATAIGAFIGQFFHWVAIGADIGLVICAYLWREELWAWLKPKLGETWHRFWREWYKP